MKYVSVISELKNRLVMFTASTHTHTHKTTAHSLARNFVHKNWLARKLPINFKQSYLTQDLRDFFTHLSTYGTLISIHHTSGTVFRAKVRLLTFWSVNVQD